MEKNSIRRRIKSHSNVSDVLDKIVLNVSNSLICHFENQIKKNINITVYINNILDNHLSLKNNITDGIKKYTFTKNKYSNDIEGIVINSIELELGSFEYDKREQIMNQFTNDNIPEKIFKTIYKELQKIKLKLERDELNTYTSPMLDLFF